METPVAVPQKKIVYSGIQPSGTLTLGNYIGALRNFNRFPEEEYQCLYCVVDMHAITVRQDPAALRKRCLELAGIYIASGLDPKKNVLYCQSHVSGHAELMWILNCFTYMGELNRMTQFKDKSAKHADNINAGLFTYPVLMAADILLFNTSVVPIGADQKQHLEICRDIAQRVNGVYGNVFTVPEGRFGKVGARVMSLQEPTAKMSKSDTNENAKVMLTDDGDAIIRKFKRAVTDSGSEVRAADDKPGITNLMSIYSAITGKDYAAIEREFEGKGYGDFKLAVGETVRDELAPLQARYRDYLADKQQLNDILAEGAARAGSIAQRTLRKVRRKVGLE